MPTVRKRKGKPMDKVIAQGLNDVKLREDLGPEQKKILLNHCYTIARDFPGQAPTQDIPEITISEPCDSEDKENFGRSESKIRRSRSPSPLSSRRDYKDEDVTPSGVDIPQGNRIIDCNQLQTMLTNVACKACGGDLQLVEDFDARKGWCSNLAFRCKNYYCTKKKAPEWVKSTPMQRHAEINRKLVLAMRTLGKGPRPARKFSAILDLPQPVQSNAWASHTKAIAEAANTALRKEQHNAVHRLKLLLLSERQQEIEGLTASSQAELTDDEKRILDDQVMDVAVSVDGSWGHRGFQAKDGIVSVISIKTGEVLDSIVMTTKCEVCARTKLDPESLEYLEFQGEHFDTCPVNHQGSAASMESEGAVTLWERSLQRLGLRYTIFIGDGDSKSYKAVTEAMPYGDIGVQRKQCIGHVQKRMGSRLREIVKKGQRLEDGKTLGGKGRLTQSRIDFFQILYGKALRGSSNSADMSKATMAILNHYSEDDDHSSCPEGSTSFCGYQKDRALGTNNFMPLKDPLPLTVVKAIEPVFKTLSDEKLMDGCVESATQNSNESLHALVWKYLPKESHNSSAEVSLGVALGILQFNDGNRSSVESIFRELGYNVSSRMVAALEVLDADRIIMSNYVAGRKEKRQLLKSKSSKQARVFHRLEGPTYKSNAFY